MDFFNSYEDETRAEAYAGLGFENTYFLAFRDIPGLIARHVAGGSTLDFGCGTGRSTRFLSSLGLRVVGVDISKEMIAKAKALDPQGSYHCIPDGDFRVLGNRSFDLILSAFTFDNIPQERKAGLFTGLSSLLADRGVLINLVSSPEIYTHEWASFTTKAYPENRRAKSGDVVAIVTKDFADSRPCYDILCSEEEYRALYAHEGLRVISLMRPLARGDEPYAWVSEMSVAPWTIYLLGKGVR